MAENVADASLIVVELGKFTKKKIKRLSQGNGVITDTIKESLAALKADGTLPAGAQPVVFVVKEKARRTSLLGI